MVSQPDWLIELRWKYQMRGIRPGATVMERAEEVLRKYGVETLQIETPPSTPVRTRRVDVSMQSPFETTLIITPKQPQSNQPSPNIQPLSPDEIDELVSKLPTKSPSNKIEKKKAELTEKYHSVLIKRRKRVYSRCIRMWKKRKLDILVGKQNNHFREDVGKRLVKRIQQLLIKNAFKKWHKITRQRQNIPEQRTETQEEIQLRIANQERRQRIRELNLEKKKRLEQAQRKRVEEEKNRSALLLRNKHITKHALQKWVEFIEQSSAIKEELLIADEVHDKILLEHNLRKWRVLAQSKKNTTTNLQRIRLQTAFLRWCQLSKVLQTKQSEQQSLSTKYATKRAFACWRLKEATVSNKIKQAERFHSRHLLAKAICALRRNQVVFRRELLRKCFIAIQKTASERREQMTTFRNSQNHLIKHHMFHEWWERTVEGMRMRELTAENHYEKALVKRAFEGLKKSAEIRNDERREERREELFRKGLSLIARFEENGTLKSTFDTSSSDDDFF